MKKFRHDAFVGGLIAVIVTLSMSPGFGQDAGDVDEAQSERFSSVRQGSEFGQGADSSAFEMGSQDIEIGPNVRVNRAQILPGAGLLGRSETTVAADEDGERVIVGFNNAQGFCGEPFGRTPACTPGTPPGLSGYGFSTNGGRAFTDGSAPPVIDHVYTRGDPWLDRGGKDRRTFFYANLAVDDRAIINPAPAPRTIIDLGVSVHRGHFRDDSFVWEDVRVFNAPNAVNLCANRPPRTDRTPCDLYDKEAIAVDKAGRGRGVITLTNFIEGCGFAADGFGQIEVWRTTNGGNTWVGPVIAGGDLTFDTNPAHTSTCGRAGRLQQSSAPAVGPDGEVFVAWQRGPDLGMVPADSVGAVTAQIVVARSLDGGATFDPPVVVATINTNRNNPPVGYNRDRINDHPRIALVTAGRFKGRIHVSYAAAVAAVTAAPAIVFTCPPGTPARVICFTRAQRLTSSQVFVKYSDDLGLTWSVEIPVAPTPPPAGLKRWWPVVTSDPSGVVAVVYYESQEALLANSTCTINFNRAGTSRRIGPASSLVNTFIATSQDGGLSFDPPVRVSTATSNWCTSQWMVFPNFGDYIGSVQAQDRVLATWADSRNGPVDTFFAPVGLEGR
jgi:hypothetical protein